MKLGIVGLPNVGKSSLFNALSKGGAASLNYPFCTIDPNVSVVNVPDYRLCELAKIYSPNKVTPAVLEFVDIAGLVKGASKGEGLGNKFLANIREVDAIIHVVRCFEDGDVIHVNGKVDPVYDAEIINLELILADVEVLTKKIAKFEKQAKSDKTLCEKILVLKQLLEFLKTGKSAREFSYNLKDLESVELINSLLLISNKPVIYAANLAEKDYRQGLERNLKFLELKKFVEEKEGILFPICSKFEEDLVNMSVEEKELFLSDLNLDGSGLDRIVKASYELLGLISYLTAGKPEVRAWTIKKGTDAKRAAGKIHSDLERGFICAEIVGYDEFIKFGNMAVVKEKGLVRTEGKNYIMQDGDIVLFRFNV